MGRKWQARPAGAKPSRASPTPSVSPQQTENCAAAMGRAGRSSIGSENERSGSAQTSFYGGQSDPGSGSDLESEPDHEGASASLGEGSALLNAGRSGAQDRAVAGVGGGGNQSSTAAAAAAEAASAAAAAAPAAEAAADELQSIAAARSPLSLSAAANSTEAELVAAEAEAAAAQAVAPRPALPVSALSSSASGSAAAVAAPIASARRGGLSASEWTEPGAKAAGLCPWSDEAQGLRERGRPVAPRPWPPAGISLAASPPRTANKDRREGSPVANSAARREWCFTLRHAQTKGSPSQPGSVSAPHGGKAEGGAGGAGENACCPPAADARAAKPPGSSISDFRPALMASSLPLATRRSAEAAVGHGDLPAISPPDRGSRLRPEPAPGRTRAPGAGDLQLRDASAAARVKLLS